MQNTTDEGSTEEPSTEGDQKRYPLREGSPLITLPEYAYDTYLDYWDVENKAEMLLFTAENGDGHAQYLQDLSAAGFEPYAENEIAGNDAGYRQKYCADSLYEMLAKYAPDPDNIVIAAFFLTHTHIDHVGGFYEFMDYYQDKVTIEQFIYNYPIRRVFEMTGTKVQHVADRMPARW